MRTRSMREVRIELLGRASVDYAPNTSPELPRGKWRCAKNRPSPRRMTRTGAFLRHGDVLAVGHGGQATQYERLG